MRKAGIKMRLLVLFWGDERGGEKKKVKRRSGKSDSNCGLVELVCVCAGGERKERSRSGERNETEKKRRFPLECGGTHLYMHIYIFYIYI